MAVKMENRIMVGFAKDSRDHRNKARMIDKLTWWVAKVLELFASILSQRVANTVCRAILATDLVYVIDQADFNKKWTCLEEW